MGSSDAECRSTQGLGIVSYIHTNIYKHPRSLHRMQSKDTVQSQQKKSQNMKEGNCGTDLYLLSEMTGLGYNFYRFPVHRNMLGISAWLSFHSDQRKDLCQSNVSFQPRKLLAWRSCLKSAFASVRWVVPSVYCWISSHNLLRNPQAPGFVYFLSLQQYVCAAQG